MKIISFIEDLDIIEKILRHLELWDIRNHDPPEPELDLSLNFLIHFSQSASLLNFFSCLSLLQPDTGTTCCTCIRLAVISWILGDYLWFAQQKASSYLFKRAGG